MNQISNPSIKTFDKTYEYYADGRLKLADENSTLYGFNKYDRSFTYDHVGRVKDAKSGIEAHGQTETDLTQLPYRQTYTHNAFGNLTGRNSTLWDYTSGDWDFEYLVSNNRVSYAMYDEDGRQTMDPDNPIDFQYDGAGRMEKTTRYEGYETLMYQDGVGAEAKRSQRTWNTQTNNWEAWDSVYFINSSVRSHIYVKFSEFAEVEQNYSI